MECSTEVVMMVLVYSDNEKLTRELLAKGRELADALGKNVTAVVIGPGDTADELIKYGADKVIVAEGGPEAFKAEEYADILAGAIEEAGSNIVLIGSTKAGKELASRLGGKIGAGCIIDCNRVYLDSGELTVERVVYSGNAVSVERFNSEVKIATVPCKAFDPLEKDDGRSGEVEKKTYQVGEYASIVAKVQEMVSQGVNVEDAQIIIAAGRGLKNREDLKMIEELAEVINGHTLGCSRPIAADLKWLSEDNWIGLSGHKVKPKLYIACGISGQIQHIAGMRDSSIIVAINKDADAPIFKSADYGIVGDLYKVVPRLIEELKKQ